MSSKSWTFLHLRYCPTLLCLTRQTKTTNVIKITDFWPLRYHPTLLCLTGQTKHTNVIKIIDFFPFEILPNTTQFNKTDKTHKCYQNHWLFSILDITHLYTVQQDRQNTQMLLKTLNFLHLRYYPTLHSLTRQTKHTNAIKIIDFSPF